MLPAKNTDLSKYVFTDLSLQTRSLRLFPEPLRNLQCSTERKNPARSANLYTSTYAPRFWKRALRISKSSAEDTVWARKSSLPLWFSRFTKISNRLSLKTISLSEFTKTLRTPLSTSPRSSTPLPQVLRAVNSTDSVRTVPWVRIKTPLRLSATIRTSTRRLISSTIRRSRAA